MEAVSPRRRFSRNERLIGVALFVWVAITAVALGLYLSMRNREPPLPELYDVAAFSFTDQNGQPFRSEALKGQVWVANFIFTRCPTICPLFTKKMAEVQKGTPSSVRLLSFTVDPAYDKPEVLKAYAETHHADPRRWTFLTGDRELLKKTIVDDMKIHVSDETADLMMLAHGGHFVLVDGNGHIRGYYNSEDEDAVPKLVHDATRLARGD